MTLENKFYVWSMPEPALLLKRIRYVDKIFANGKWSDTRVIIDYMYGNNDFVDPITEEQARAKYPEAF